jgi:pimeloyl-ACP methyl ester carboxylesterase
MAPLLENNIRHWDICTTLPSTLTDLQAFSTPTRIVCGGQSNPAAQAIAKHLNELLPNSQKYWIDGASHFMLNTHFDDCFAALQDSFGERS